MALQRRRPGWMVVVVAGLMAAGSVHAATIYVSTAGNDANDGLSWGGAKKTVQAGLSAATAGDQVWVAAGTYVGRITLKAGTGLYGGFSGDESDLGQRDWKANVTVLDGNKAGSVVTAPTWATTDTRIDGFTIRNGTGTYSPESDCCGGGVYCYGASPTIANNTIVSNSAEGGAGIYCASSSAVIDNNTITGNNASGWGGGVYTDYRSSPRITNNTIAGNRARGSSGGIGCSGGTIASNVVIGNRAAHGGGICAQGRTTVANCTVAGNGACYGGGIYCDPSATIVNTIVAFNSSGITTNWTVAPSLQRNCVYGNAAYNYLGLPDPTGTNGNISCDPKMAGLAYGRGAHIQFDSPCVDAGDDSAIGGGWVDMDGQGRTLGAHVDIGADESDGTVWPAGPGIVVRVAPDGDDAADGLSWATPKRTVQAGINAAAQAGGEVWVKAGTYNERASLPAYVHLYGGFAGIETDRSDRDWMHNATILDGGRSGIVISANDTGCALSTIDGFTIRNGTTAGIYCLNASPTVANNTITGNPFGMCCSYSHPLIAGNAISANGAGGGIYCKDYSAPTIVRNTITSNTGSKGAGIYCYWDCPALIAENVIAGNAATGSYGGGGGIYSDGIWPPTIRNNTITNNTASTSGGGIWSAGTIAGNHIAGNSAPTGAGIACTNNTIVNNTIVGNRATGADGRGGGIYNWAPGATIAGNTITGNSAASGGGIYCKGYWPVLANTIIAFNSSGVFYTGSGSGPGSSLRYNCVYGNGAYDYFGLTDPTGTNGNISADPLFATAGPGADRVWGTIDDVFGDLRLLPWSPCIDAGQNAGVAADVADLDQDGDTAETLPIDLAGVARFLDDPQSADTGAGAAPIVDIGAFERGRPAGDVDGDWLTDVVDLLYVVYAFGSISGDANYEPRCDFNADGAVDIEDLMEVIDRFGK